MRGAGTQGQAQWLCPLWPLRPPPRLDPKGEKVLLLAGGGASPAGRCPWPWDPETRKCRESPPTGLGIPDAGCCPSWCDPGSTRMLRDPPSHQLGGLQARGMLGPGAWPGLSQDLGHGSAGWHTPPTS